ncbi:oxidative stress survival, Svf1-like protein [Entophlyctis helioformis]|nr:oxidative stress survival, Svf1-like protein [Entophlyctis helioformis]
MADTAAPPDAFKWVVNLSGSTEGQQFYFITDSGVVGFVQLVYSTMNSWSHSTQITARIYLPDNTIKCKAPSGNAGGFKLSDDRLSVSASGIISITHKPDAGGPAPSYKITFNSPGEIDIDIDVAGLVKPLQLDGGKRFHSPGNEANGYIAARFVAKTKISGKIVVDGKSYDAAGYGHYSHVVQSPPQNIARWNFVNFQNATDALMLYQYQTPKGKYAQDQVSQGTLILNNEIVAITVNNHTIFHGTYLDDFSGYRVPTSLTHVWEGTALDGEPIKIVMDLNLKRMVEKINVLGELPFLLRKFIEAFITKPFVYQWVEDTEITVTKGGKESKISGRVHHENTFLYELEQP